MMKMLLTYLFLPLFSVATEGPKSEDIESLRLGFFRASQTLDLRKDFHREATSLASKEAIVLAYQGAAKALLAEVVLNPYSKLSNFNEGKDLIESAISKDNQNAEIRYLRFMIQANSPEFLNYRDNLKEDHDVIVSFIAQAQKRETWMTHFESFISTKKHTIEALNNP